jgi:hypothetical protein
MTGSLTDALLACLVINLCLILWELTRLHSHVIALRKNLDILWGYMVEKEVMEKGGILLTKIDTPPNPKSTTASGESK